MSAFIQGGLLILTPDDARMLYQGAKIGELRARHRSGDSRFYALLVEISKAAFTVPNATNGTEPRQETASEERETWTVNQIAKAARLAPRTVRLDCENGTLPANKAGNVWIIRTDEATTYINRRSKN